ncbi:hypothetical protein BJY01DRAFT_254178 [Aspergillus pseudoustus]|uniref:Zn(2)-C6 fungal-type domain-containing protein n=1 Tax=Aspergillus pseudoustus TaxID=1810923 RepID=A0ABR4IV57_9EURO
MQQRVKHTRNQNACDVCRRRRVKCRFSEQGDVLGSCDGCRFLGVECTNVRPRRKRGPPNRHAISGPSDTTQPQAQSAPGPVSPGTNASSTSQTSAVHITAPSIIAARRPLLPNLHITSPLLCLPSSSPEGDEDILSLLAPLPLIITVLNDWFTHIHPLAPILHRRSFLARLHSGESHSNRNFCGLVISILAATCATLRRKSFAEYHPIITLARCQEIIVTYELLPADGSSYCLDWCIAKYNLGTAATACGDLSDPWIWKVLGEAMTGTRWLLMMWLKNDDNSLSSVDRELLKRLYCLLIICQIALDMTGHQPMGRLAFDTPPAQYLPQALTDNDLAQPSTSIPILSAMETEEVPWWDGETASYVPGLTHLLSIFLTWHTCQADRFYHSPSQVLTTGLLRIRRTLDALPPELRWRGGMSRPPTATRGHDVQIANIFITSLYVRSNLLLQFGDQSGGEHGHGHDLEEHQSIVGDLLEVLYHLPQPILEANGYSLIPKIRDIGAAYLEVLQGGGDVVAIDDEAKGKLERLLRQLGVLDFRPDLSTVGR